ncbi:MAG: nitrous oxide reductase accessory protein NosL [Pseudomonadota bacterium]
MNIRVQRFVVTVMAMFLLAGASSYLNAAQDVALPDGSKVQLPVTCPVCEMKIESDSAVLGALVFADGKVVLFDNISEFFRYLLSPQTFGFDTNNIKKSFVVDHESKKFIDPKASFYVIGPETVPMMGPEMNAFSKKEEAEKFAGAADKKVLAFSEVSLQDVGPKKKVLKLKHSDSTKPHQKPMNGGHSSH